jgi:photosystem II stability/assembly factor-like uncharacterized protein
MLLLKSVFVTQIVALILLSILHRGTTMALEWVQISVPPSSSSFVSLSYSSEFNVVATAQSGTGSSIIRSVDNGLTWTTCTYTDGDFGFIYDLISRRVSGVDYFLAIDDTGNVYKSVNNGTTWTTAAVITSFSGYAVSIGSNGVAYVAGSGYKVYSASASTGYTTWSSKSVTGITPLSNFFDVSTYNGVNVIVVASKGLIYYSSNSGTSWTKSTSGVPDSTVIAYCVDHGSALTAMVSALCA